VSQVRKSPFAIRHSLFAIRHWHWAFIIALLLLTWGLRLCFLEEVPPGWRDDDLINIHALSGQLLEGRFPLYYPEASGHEPLYHHLHAGVHAALGFNVLSGRILSAAFGTLTIALTYTLTRRLFGRAPAVIASLALTTSFWSLMYSRFALRHISLPPTALATLYVFWHSIESDDRLGYRRAGLLGLLLAASLYTYTAARVLPALPILFVAYLALFHRDRFRRHWRGIALALAVMIVLVVPMGIAIARGRSERAIEGIGADARIDKLAVPLRELHQGNPRPLLENIWVTLGMFHATGDPEWLYNISGRPVFNLLGGALLWGGLGLCLVRWREPRYFLLLLWLGLGLLPTFASIPPASLSHTILVQPVAYILPAVLVDWYIRKLGDWEIGKLGNWEIGRLGDWHTGITFRQTCQQSSHQSTNLLIYQSTSLLLTLVFLITNGVRDLRDYFVHWPQYSMVRFLYRADYRAAAQYLNTHPQTTDLAISSALLGPWDRLALDVDTQREEVAVRLFNPERALIWPSNSKPETQNSSVILTSWPDPAPYITDLLNASDNPAKDISPHLTLHTIRYSQFVHNSSFAHSPIRAFSNGLSLTEARWLHEETLAPGREAILLTAWRVAEPLDLPPMPVVANPPPPKTYTGPRLSVFAHLLAADGGALAIDDGLWVDPLTLRPGDHFVQIHRFTIPQDASNGPYTLQLGLYDPMTGERWRLVEPDETLPDDRVLIPVGGKR